MARSTVPAPRHDHGWLGHGLGLFPPPPGAPLPAFMMPVRLPDGREGRAVYALSAHRPPRPDALVILALVLGVVGVASLQPTSAEQQTILAWIVCGAPDN